MAMLFFRNSNVYTVSAMELEKSYSQRGFTVGRLAAFEPQF